MRHENRIGNLHLLDLAPDSLQREEHPVAAIQPGWSDELTALHEQESANHVIDVASREATLDALRRFGCRSDGAILEIGSSSGHMLHDLSVALPSAKLIGSEVIDSVAQRLGERVDFPVLTLDVVYCDLPTASFDAIVALNVLEHVDDDAAAVRQITRLLEPDGLFVCEVPAGPHLYDGYDATLRHHRRYSRASLRTLVQSSGLKIIEQNAIGFVIYPAFWAIKKLNRLRYGIEPNEALTRRSIRKSSDSMVTKASFNIEKRLRRFMRLPFGIRHTIVAAKSIS
jgi:SAM-dependent methyltransferase